MEARDIVSTYDKTGSLKETAKICDVNWQKVRKILITEGKYESDLSISVNKMHQEGKSVSEISEALKINVKAVNSYLPYEKGIYNLDSPSVNADRIRKFRENMIDK